MNPTAKKVFVVTMIGLASANSVASVSCFESGAIEYCSDGSIGYYADPTYNSDGTVSGGNGLVYYSSGGSSVGNENGTQFYFGDCSGYGGNCN